MKNKIIFHPGFPKTASTFLSEFFLNINDIDTLYQIKQHNSFWELNSKLFNSTEMINKNTYVDEFINLINDYQSNKNIYLYSYAGIFNPYRYNIKTNLKNFYNIINKLKINFNVQILFTLREQNSMLKSLFISEYDVLRHKFIDLNDFMDHEFSEKRINQFLDYNFLHDQVLNNTGIKPSYLFYEDLLNHSNQFSTELSEILGVDIVNIKEKKVNQTKRNEFGYEFIDNKFYYQMYKFNLFLNKNVKFYYQITKGLKKRIKMLLPKKFIKDIDIRHKKYFELSNKEFFRKIEIYNKFQH